MNEKLLHLNFENWGIFLLSLIPALINFSIFFYTSFFLPQNKINSIFSIFVILLGISQITDGLMRMSITEETAYLFNRLSIAPWVFTLPFGLLFVLFFTKWHKKVHYPLLMILLFLPAMLLEAFIIARLDKYNIVKSETWNWIANPEPTLVTIIIFLWISITALITLILLWVYYFQESNNKRKRIQTLLLALGYTVPFIAGIIADLFFPLILRIDGIPLTTPTITAFSIASLIAIKKYNLFDYSPIHQWNKIIEHMNEGILIVDNSDRIMYANKKFCQFTEFEFDEIKGKIANELFVEDINHKKQVTEAIKERKNNVSGQFELQMKTKSGKKIWMLMNGSPYVDKGGNVIGSIGIQTNIDDLKKAEITIKQNESRLKQAQEIAKIGSWELSFTTYKAIWSDEACKIYGLDLTENEQSFQQWLSFIHPEDFESVSREIKKSQEELSDSSFCHRIICKKGKIKHIHSISKFKFDEFGNPIGMHGICHDITEKTKTQNSLIENKQRLKTFTNDSLLSIFFVNAKTKKIIYANPAFIQLLGYSAQELLSLKIYDFINHSKENVDEQIAKTLQAKKIDIGEREWKTKKGEIIYVLLSSFYQKRNKTDIIFGTAQDITARKKAEQKLIVANKELETYIYKASHDLRGPLASILGLIQVSITEIKDEASTKYFTIISDMTKKLDDMLAELIKSMAIRDTTKFNDEINFHELIKETLNTFQHIKEYSRIKIYTNISLSYPFLSNQFILRTIFQNLIGNSIKYQNYSQKESFLKINISQKEKNIKITFEDNGMGIEKSLHVKIFDMYYRANEQSKGSGLGLYLVKKGIEKLNGEIQVNSILGKGTTFTIVL